MTTQTAPTPTLTFPRPIFAAVSPHPFLLAHLANPSSPQRANARTHTEARIPAVNTGSLTHCQGSAVVRLGGTSVVCGVRGEILKYEDAMHEGASPSEDAVEEENEDLYVERTDLEALKLLVPNVEVSTGSAPQYIPGNAPSQFAQTLITRLHSLLLSTSLVRTSDLRILYTPPVNPEDPDSPPRKEVKAYWTLYIDIFFISIDGNAFDSAWLAILAALRNTRLPNAYWDEELETILCDDDTSTSHGLRLRGLPVPSTFAVFEGGHQWRENGDEDEGDRHWVLSDPDAFEESVCREGVTVVVDGSSGTAKNADVVIKRVEKNGGSVVGREEMKGLVRRAAERWEVVSGVLDAQA